MDHKPVYYSVNPRYFKDSNHDGIGDFIGLGKQINYFKKIGVDALILQDIFAHDEKIYEPFINLKSDLGTTQEFATVIKHLHKHQLKVLLELPFELLGHNYLWFKKAENAAISFTTREFYLLQELTSEISLNSDQTLITNLMEIISLWQSLGVDGFVIKNFEYLGNPNGQEPLNERTLNLLNKLHSRVKVRNKECLWIGLSEQLSYEQINNLTHFPLKLFDKIMSYEIATIGISKKVYNDYLGLFNPKKLVKSLQKVINNEYAILAFGAPERGRIISRWGDDLSYWKEASKCLATIFYLNKTNSNIFFGDEIGLPNYLFHNLEDQIMIEKKRELQASGFKLSKIIAGQKLHHPHNARQAIPWNNQKNGGFSKRENVEILINHLYDEINIANQLNDNHSILDFNCKLIALTKSNFFRKMFKYGTVKIYNKLNGVIVIKGHNNFDRFSAYINLSKATKSLRMTNLFNRKPIVLSTYHQRNYFSIPRKLSAYEGIILLKTSKEYAKENNVLK